MSGPQRRLLPTNNGARGPRPGHSRPATRRSTARASTRRPSRPGAAEPSGDQLPLASSRRPRAGRARRDLSARRSDRGGAAHWSALIAALVRDGLPRAAARPAEVGQRLAVDPPAGRRVPQLPDLDPDLRRGRRLAVVIIGSAGLLLLLGWSVFWRDLHDHRARSRPATARTTATR